MSGIPSLYYSSIQNHSPLISGTFTLSINNKNISVGIVDQTLNSSFSTYNIPFTMNNIYFLPFNIKEILGYPHIEIDIVTRPLFNDGFAWIISYVGVNADVIPPTVSSNFTGGRQGELQYL